MRKKQLESTLLKVFEGEINERLKSIEGEILTIEERLDSHIEVLRTISQALDLMKFGAAKPPEKPIVHVIRDWTVSSDGSFAVISHKEKSDDLPRP